jgi:hypothetical protein
MREGGRERERKRERERERERLYFQTIFSVNSAYSTKENAMLILLLSS